jgi:hypothetical protein
MRRERIGKSAHEGAGQIVTRPQLGQRQWKRVIDYV